MLLYTDATSRLKGRAGTDAKESASIPDKNKTEVSLQDIIEVAKTIIART